MKTLEELAVFENPDPKPDGVPVIDLLIDYLSQVGARREIIDGMKARVGLGISRYGQPLYTNDGRDTMGDLIPEIMDALIYAQKGVAMSDASSAQAEFFAFARRQCANILREYIIVATTREAGTCG
jgi:hypothetical protein